MDTNRIKLAVRDSVHRYNVQLIIDDVISANSVGVFKRYNTLSSNFNTTGRIHILPQLTEKFDSFQISRGKV